MQIGFNEEMDAIARSKKLEWLSNEGLDRRERERREREEVCVGFLQEASIPFSSAVTSGCAFSPPGTAIFMFML